MKSKKIMILGASILQLPAIQQAKEMGLHVIAVDMNPDAIGFKESGIQCEVISTIDIPAVLKCAKENAIDGIMTLASDMPMQTVALVAEELGLVGISKETALKATNKAFMRDALQDCNVPIPLYHRVNDYQGFLEAVNDIVGRGYKCIVKPADNSGSRGVDLLKSQTPENLQKAYDYSKTFSRTGELVVEEYMEGSEVSVETLSINGMCHVIQITDKITTGAPYFVEMGHSQPSMLSEKIKEEIAEVAKAANKALGIMDGPSHTEIKVTKDGPKIVELGARLGGDNITTHLVPLSTGVNMVECCIKIALGEAPDLTVKCNKAATIRYFKTSCGIVKNIIGIHDAELVPGVKQVSIVHGVGEELKEIKSSTDRAGFVICQADSVVEAVNECEVAIGKVQFIM